MNKVKKKTQDEGSERKQREKKRIRKRLDGTRALLPAGLEPATFALPTLSLEAGVLVRSSNQLSYGSAYESG